MRQFEDYLALGQIGEAIVTRWLLRGERNVIPLHAAASERYKGPCLLCYDGDVVLPDLLVTGPKGMSLVEVKLYMTSPLNRTFGKRVHGFKRAHVEDYRRAGMLLGLSVKLVIAEVDSGEVIHAELEKLRPIPCMCEECASGCKSRCKSPVKDELYFFRDDFSHLFSMSDEEKSWARLAFDKTKAKQ